MKPKLFEHALSIAFVSALLLVLLFFAQSAVNAVAMHEQSRLKAYGNLNFVDFKDPFHKALLKDVMNIYYPDQYDTNAVIVGSILASREQEFENKLQKSYLEEKLSPRKLLQLLGMYVKFLIVYIIVMFLTYYGVQTLAVLRYVKKKQHAQRTERAARATLADRLQKIIGAVGKTAAYFVLFSPAYVIAYSIRTEFNTDTVVFMALLGVISNGLLVTYMNKFYAFLIAESRKGYVETAVVKNLNVSYDPHAAGGISYKDILRPAKRFTGHVFDHIFKNARRQYLSTIKEQASFLITGLIIIEMALNIHGHLSYELLRQLLYKNYDIVIVIVLGIFYTVKGTEIFVDWMMNREEKKYENK
jgi:hypothetical protein